jgi:glycosyltransferase involved in cell wall biosynthesis
VMTPPGDVPALAATLIALVGDPARRRALAESGRARATEFSWPRVTDRLEGVYRDVLARRAGVPTAA